MISKIDVMTFIAMLLICIFPRFAYPSGRVCASEIGATWDRGQAIGKVE